MWNSERHSDLTSRRQERAVTVQIYTSFDWSTSCINLTLSWDAVKEREQLCRIEGLAEQAITFTIGQRGIFSKLSNIDGTPQFSWTWRFSNSSTTLLHKIFQNISIAFTSNDFFSQSAVTDILWHSWIVKLLYFRYPLISWISHNMVGLWTTKM